MPRLLLPISPPLPSPTSPSSPASGVHRGAALTSTPRTKGGDGSSRATMSQPVACTSNSRALVPPTRYCGVTLINSKKPASARSSAKLKNFVSRCSATFMDSLSPRKEEPVEFPALSELSVLGTSIEETHWVEHGFVETQVDSVCVSGQRADQSLSSRILETTGSNRGGECQARNQPKQTIRPLISAQQDCVVIPKCFVSIFIIICCTLVSCAFPVCLLPLSLFICKWKDNGCAPSVVVSTLGGTVVLAGLVLAELMSFPFLP